MKKNIILIRNAAASDFGGAEKVPVFLARELSSYGLSATIFTSSEKLINFAKSENVLYKKTWWWSRQNWSGKKAVLFPFYVGWQLILYGYYLALFVRFSPTTVHIQSKDDFIAATIAARTFHIPVFWSDYADLKHIWKNHSIWYKNPIGKLVYWAARYAREIIVVSKEDLELISREIPNGRIKDKLKVIYNGAFDTYHPTTKEFIFTFTSTARLVHDKGIRELIEAFGKLRTNYTARLDIVGDGPDKNEFVKIAQPIPDVRFIGYQTNPLTYVARSQVFVLPTYHEGFSLALIEACMEGVAIITTDVGGNKEIIKHKENGLLIKARDVDELYNAMELLLRDEKLRTTLAKKARQTYVKSFDFEKIIKREFLPLYENDNHI